MTAPVIELRGLARTYPGPPPVYALRPTDLVIGAGIGPGESAQFDHGCGHQPLTTTRSPTASLPPRAGVTWT